jgi:nucleosome binding factor SPN SPT16 subunit
VSPSFLLLQLADDSSCDVPLSEGPVNLSWPQIMKTVNDDTYGFYEEGGWSFLTGTGSVSTSP